MENIENGMLGYTGKIWGKDYYEEEPERRTYFTPYIKVEGREIVGEDYHTVEEAFEELDEMKADNKYYDDAYVTEKYEDGTIIEYYD